MWSHGYPKGFKLISRKRRGSLEVSRLCKITVGAPGPGSGAERMITGRADSEALSYEESFKCSPESHELDTTGEAWFPPMPSGVQEASGGQRCSILRHVLASLVLYGHIILVVV